jgi:hypothetical protein
VNRPIGLKTVSPFYLTLFLVCQRQCQPTYGVPVEARPRHRLHGRASTGGTTAQYTERASALYNYTYFRYLTMNGVGKWRGGVRYGRRAQAESYGEKGPRKTFYLPAFLPWGGGKPRLDDQHQIWEKVQDNEPFSGK